MHGVQSPGRDEGKEERARLRRATVDRDVENGSFMRNKERKESSGAAANAHETISERARYP